ncbi:MAG: Ig-like domain-containing protein [Bacteroidales bacterium]|nr:Ig-like domain-containing protein [Bacteroidales bacterium]
MKRLFELFSAALVAVLVSLTLFSCGHEDPVPATVGVSGVSINKTTLSLTEGGSETLTATVAPDNATNKAVSWKSSDTGVATVDNSGKVTAVKAGSATITVTTNDGSKTATCSVSVASKTVSVTAISLDKTTLELAEGAEETLKATITPADATNQVVTWSTSDHNVANVSDGKVTAVKAGEATITVTTSDGGKTATCKVTVKSVALEGLSVNPATLEIVEGGTKQLEVIFTPEAFGDKTVQWASDNTNVVTVDNDGLITAVKPGTAKVFVESQADKTKQAFCEVTVTPDPTLKGISFPYTSLTMIKGEAKQFQVVYNPDYAANKKVTWKSSDPAVATVDDAGIVTAVWNGEADITATSEEGGFTATCKVTVSQQEGVQVYIRTHAGVFLNGDDFVGSRPELNDIYYDGTDFYECYVYGGIYKNGTQFLKNFYKSGDFMGMVAGRLYYFDNYMIKIYDAENGNPLFEEMLSTANGYRNEAMVVAADGTAYVAGYSFDAFGKRVGRLWTISKGFEITEKTMYHGGSEEISTDLAFDGEGNVWALTKADGCLNLYKNGEYVRSIDADRDGNQDHFLSFHDKDLYVVTTLRTQKDVVVYKNDKILYKVSSTDGLMARSKPLFSKDGDLYFAAGSSGIGKSHVYKNGNILYTVGGEYVFRLFVVD